MKILKIISTAAIASSFFVGCVNTQVNQTVPMKEKIVEKKEQLETTVVETIQKVEEEVIIVKDENLNLSQNERDFLEILKTDKYASICGNNEDYLQISHINDDTKKSQALNDLFYNYTKNLSNSCINQSAFKKTLKKSKYRKMNQDYEMYNQKINKASLLKQFKSDTTSVESILAKYTPKHPDFFKFISKLDDESLSENEKHRLRLNVERLKLLKDYKPNGFVQLNVPSHNFKFYEDGNITKTFGTVVGSIEHQTPILSSRLTHFIVNPTWNIPDSIAKKSIIPKALKDKNYLRKKNIVIRKNYNLSSKKFKFKDIKWKKYLKENVKYIPYKFIQLPSSTNGMGRVKFMFPNAYAVYMHDTMGTWRFKSSKQKIRFVSHGCIRLEHPVSFMQHVSTNYTSKSYQSVRKTYDSNKTGSISLSKRLPVHITYITSKITNGKVSFYSDIYGYDKLQKLNF